jgi:branched-chain amino acid transport system permease protein
VLQRVSQFTNWAFGSFMVAGAFAGYYAVKLFHWPFWAAIIFAVVVTMAVSMLTERGAYRPLRMRNAPRLFMMISALGADTALVNIMNMVFGGEYRRFPDVTTGSLSIGGVSPLARWISSPRGYHSWCWAACGSFCSVPRRDSAFAASAIDWDGGDHGHHTTAAWRYWSLASRGVLSASSGIFCGIKYAVYPTLGSMTIKAMIATVIGGLGSLPGAVVGSLLLGVSNIGGGVLSLLSIAHLFAFIVFNCDFALFPEWLVGRRRSTDKL